MKSLSFQAFLLDIITVFESSIKDKIELNNLLIRKINFFSHTFVALKKS